jgi:hypothetical protein
MVKSRAFAALVKLECADVCYTTATRCVADERLGSLPRDCFFRVHPPPVSPRDWPLLVSVSREVIL